MIIFKVDLRETRGILTLTPSLPRYTTKLGKCTSAINYTIVFLILLYFFILLKFFFCLGLFFWPESNRIQTFQIYLSNVSISKDRIVNNNQKPTKFSLSLFLTCACVQKQRNQQNDTNATTKVKS